MSHTTTPVHGTHLNQHHQQHPQHFKQQHQPHLNKLLKQHLKEHFNQTLKQQPHSDLESFSQQSPLQRKVRASVVSGKVRNCLAAGCLWGMGLSLGFMTGAPAWAAETTPANQANQVNQSSVLVESVGSANASNGEKLGAHKSALLAENKMVEVFTYNAKREESSVPVPLNPQRVAVIDYAILDIMHELGVGDSIVGVPQATAPTYLHAYTKNSQLVNTGTIKDVDLEALIALEPDVIFIGGRLAAQYDQLSKIAPVVLLAVDYQKPLLDSVQRSTEVIAKIFSKQQQAQATLDGFAQRIERLKAQAQNHTAVVGLVNASQFKTLGDQGRCSFIGRDLGFNNLAADINSTHGNESNFELLVKLNPEFIFVLDRDSAIGRQGAQLAQDVMRNELVAKTQAAQNQRIYFLNPSVWYMSEGGIKATDLMLQDIEKAFD